MSGHQQDKNKEADTNKGNFVLIFSDQGEGIQPLVARLKKEGYRVGSTQSMESAAYVYSRQRPNFIIIRLHCHIRDIINKLHCLMNKRIDLKNIPSLLLVRNSEMQYQTSLLKAGFDDVVASDCKINVLMHKTKTIRLLYDTDPNTQYKSSEQESGSRGNLSNMNLIDLLQALGPSRRTSCITIIPEGADSVSDHLFVYLDQGRIIYAKLGDLLGETAVYRAIGWDKGNWIVEPVLEDNLPEPNTDLSNEAILMEGCRLLDEESRVKQA